MNNRWRTVDIVVASVIAVAFGVVFWAWNLLWSATGSLFTFFPPAQSVLYGTWLLPAVLGGLIIRKPGAAVYCEALASAVSALLGSPWGALVIAQSIVQGAGAELVFAAFRYRRYSPAVAAAAGFAAGLFAACWDVVTYYPTNSLLTFQLPYVLITALSALVIAGLGGYASTTAIAATGVLDRFPAGRDRAAI